MEKRDPLIWVLLCICVSVAVAFPLYVGAMRSSANPSNVMEMKLREEAIRPVGTTVLLEPVETQAGPFMWRMYDRSTRVACYAPYSQTVAPTSPGIIWDCTRATLTAAPEPK